MRWVVVGAAGMLGRDVVARLRQGDDEVVELDRAGLDITSPDECAAAVAGADVVVNCAGYTAVDDAETHEAEAFTANAVGPATLARATADAGARLVQISTDYVFDGRATTPYDEDAPQAPRGAYGRTKAAGEWAVAASGGDHLVVRTAWLYGAHGSSFPRTIARVARERGSLDVVDDQRGQPTWTVDVADAVARLVAARAPRGTYHATSSGETTWFGFARAVVAAAGLDPAIVAPTTSEKFVRPAPRPAYSVLGHGALAHVGLAPIGDWRERWEAAAGAVLGEEES
ncbi:dTDP-4-dehydrorhamnose reductase [Cellulomonas palmilytica]|uniref:dTDP-4-dehydrorhamnose reductase n=1 Tax=Cellulomonas palmilytica TaxID=2608402 RepID=UPI001F17C4E1|nr:dTDP-4-dehydrorhamnose reductase [Cellulomonas palmilytica]UJP41019.1 dTDP-4-dehydrorhamnose reductase [Cellulomonas palmilytica]